LGYFYFEQFFENYISSLNYSHGKAMYILIWTKMALGNIMGDIFANSSGHPGVLALIINIVIEVFCKT
jgi:hypothetical protein